MRHSWLIALLGMASFPAVAATPAELVQSLANHDAAGAALDQLVALGAAAVPSLGAAAADGHDLTQRGWALVALRRIGGADADGVLRRIVENPQQPVVVRTWAAAARIDLAPDLDSVLALAPLAREYPAVRRPLLQRVSAISASGKPLRLERLLEAASQDYALQSALGPLVAAAPVESLLQAMLHAASQPARQLAAGYLASRGQQPGGAEAVATAVVQGVSFQPGAAAPPWSGGPLYIPGIAWTRGPARQLFGELVRWQVWAELRSKPEVQRQVDQSLNSVGLAGVAGYNPTWGDVTAETWLREWARTSGGREAVRQLLAEQGAEAEPRFQAMLRELK